MWCGEENIAGVLWRAKLGGVAKDLPWQMASRTWRCGDERHIWFCNSGAAWQRHRAGACVALAASQEKLCESEKLGEAAFRHEEEPVSMQRISGGGGVVNISWLWTGE
jgi:hypothetical protein